MTPSRSAAPAGKRNATAATSGASKPAKPGRGAKSGAASRAAKANGKSAKVADAAPERSAEQTMLLVGARIRAIRVRQRLTLKDIAERTGVSVSMLSMLERGVST